MKKTAAILFAIAISATAQTNMGPIRTPQINQNLYVGQSGYPTIQSAVSFACRTGNQSFAVIIPAGAAPSDSPTAVTGGCPNTYIADLRAALAQYYFEVAGGHYTQVPSPMVYPPAGIAQSTGSAWGTSINPASLTPYPPAGIPVSTGSTWGTPINPATVPVTDSNGVLHVPYYGYAPISTQQLIRVGDALATAVTGPQRWSAVLSTLPFFNNRATLTDLSFTSQTCAAMTTNYAANVQPLKPNGTTITKSYLMISEGINELLTSPATWETCMDAYMTQAKTDGFTVVLMTLTPISNSLVNSTQIANFQTINNYIRADAIPNLVIDANQMFSNPTDTTWFSGGIAPTPAASRVMAQAINSIFQSGTNPQNPVPMDMNNPTFATINGAVPGTGGGGGANYPATPGVVYNTSISAARNATGADLAAAGKSINPSSVFMTDTPPTAPGTNNVALGAGVGSHLAPGTSGAGGQSDVYIGALAGNSATTQRESVVIGANAGQNVTGNGSGPDDMIFVLIGSDAGLGLTNLGGAGVMIGQKAGVNTTNSARDVIIGTHAAIGELTGQDNVLLGNGVLDTGTADKTLERTTLIGSYAANNAAASTDIPDTTCVGYQCFKNLNGGVQNTAVGSNAALNQTSGSNNVALGYGAETGTTGGSNIALGATAGTSTTTGSNGIALGQGAQSGTTTGYNISLGPGAGGNLTSGSNNIIYGQTGGPSSGSNNYFLGYGSGGGVRTGNGNVFIGSYAGQNSADVNYGVVAVGHQAAQHAQDLMTAIGVNAGTQATGDFNTFVGWHSGLNVVAGASNTAVGNNTLPSVNGTESNNTVIGDTADVAAGVSGTVELGPGQCARSNTQCFKGLQVFGTTLFSVSGCGTATGLVGVATAGQFTGGSATCTPVITMGVTAPHGFSCHMNDQTTATAAFRQTANTTTTATFTAGGTVGATDVINFGCNVF